MIVILAAFPAVLLGLLLVMERVERPLEQDDVGGQLDHFLRTARPEDIETFVSEGYAPALDRYWRRRRSRLFSALPRRSG